MPHKKSTNTSLTPEYDNTPAVDALVEAMPDPVRAITVEIRKLVMQADRRITEGLKWNSPSFYWNGWFATVNSRKGTEVTLVLHHGPAVRNDSEVRSVVSDAAQLLRWHSVDRASVTVANLQEFKELQTALTSIVNQWANYHSALPHENTAKSKENLP
jgi:hypothetical protein